MNEIKLISLIEEWNKVVNWLIEMNDCVTDNKNKLWQNEQIK